MTDKEITEELDTMRAKAFVEILSKARLFRKDKIGYADWIIDDIIKLGQLQTDFIEDNLEDCIE